MGATHFTGPVISDGAFQNSGTPTDYDGDDAIDPGVNVATLSKGSAASATLAAPGASNVGRFLLAVAASAQAHVITITGLDSTEDTLTFGGAIGDSVFLYARSATVWTAVAYDGVTPTTAG